MAVVLRTFPQVQSTAHSTCAEEPCPEHEPVGSESLLAFDWCLSYSGLQCFSLTLVIVWPLFRVVVQPPPKHAHKAKAAAAAVASSLSSRISSHPYTDEALRLELGHRLHPELMHAIVSQYSYTEHAHIIIILVCLSGEYETRTKPHTPFDCVGLQLHPELQAA